MGEDQQEEVLASLEGVVEKLLGEFKTVKQEKAEVEALLRQRQFEVEELQELVATLKEEKGVVHQRVSGLLNSIQEWERNQVVNT